MSEILHPQAPIEVLVVDDEHLARWRLRALLEACRDPEAKVLAEAGSASTAQAWLREHRCDLVLLDVQMPGIDGLTLAAQLRALPQPPLLIFVTAHAHHALEAFSLEAVDYLTKPVRLERLQAALVRVATRLRERAAARSLPQQPAVEASDSEEVLSISDRGRLLRVRLSEVLYFKAELKYLTVRTLTERLVMEGSLNDWEQRLTGRFLRIHRNALVALGAVRELGRHRPSDLGDSDSDFAAMDPADAAELWSVRVGGVNEWLVVSRRQLAAVRDTLRHQHAAP